MRVSPRFLFGTLASLVVFVHVFSLLVFIFGPKIYPNIRLIRDSLRNHSAKVSKISIVARTLTRSNNTQANTAAGMGKGLLKSNLSTSHQQSEI